MLPRGEGGEHDGRRTKKDGGIWRLGKEENEWDGSCMEFTAAGRL